LIHGSSFTDIIFIFVLVTVSFLTLNSIYNLLTAPRLRKNLCLPDAEEKHISILIPARNEENNIAACLDSVLAQEYVNYEEQEVAMPRIPYFGVSMKF